MSTSSNTAASITPDARALKDGIAEFYDESSGLWENIWGDHMHHGFYDPESNVSESDHRAAQIRMIEESLRFAGISGSGFCIFSIHVSCFNWTVVCFRDLTLFDQNDLRSATGLTKRRLFIL